MIRKGLLFLSDSGPVRKILTGVPLARGASRRFVAGETLDEFIRAAGQVQRQGFEVTGNHLGEAVQDTAGARSAMLAYLQLLDAMHGAGLEANISVKLSQMGMDVSASVLRDHVGTLLARAEAIDAFVRFDMESSMYTERTLQLFLELREEGRRGIGIVLQAALRRTAGDVQRMIEAGASVRLCKGAYAEPPELAFQDPREVRASFRELMRRLLREGARPAIATHDEDLIRDALRYCEEDGIGLDRFDFELLYGVRRDLQRELVDRGARVRVYIPYGDNWYPYLMRRLAERPENVLFTVSSVLKESPLGSLFPGRRGLGDDRR